MPRRFALLFLSCGLIWPPLLLSAPAAAGGAAASAAPVRLEACRAARDRALARLDEERRSLLTLFDTDAAALDAPVYTLERAQRALLDQLRAERRQAEQRYRQCVAAVRPPPAR
ncbi:MAG: hypothetical protein MJE12_21330 [Alphaproteobacteria bacterium]|nr:hypothetical protein [Alphaproteobacteria bacterium]